LALFDYVSFMTGPFCKKMYNFPLKLNPWLSFNSFFYINEDGMRGH